MAHKMLSSEQCTAEDLCFSLQARTEIMSLLDINVWHWNLSGCVYLTHQNSLWSAGDTLRYAGGDHGTRHGSLWFPRGPHCGRSRLWVTHFHIYTFQWWCRMLICSYWLSKQVALCFLAKVTSVCRRWWALCVRREELVSSPQMRGESLRFIMRVWVSNAKVTLL